MKIERSGGDGQLLLKLTGRLDTTTSPLLEEELGTLEGVNDLQLDLAKMDYLSSAGLRVLLKVSKIMDKQGTMTVVNVNRTVMEVFNITGFSDILTIQ